jgi:hypothetical protein
MQMTLEDMDRLAEQALDSACLTIQQALFNDATGDGTKLDGGIASMFFTGEYEDIVKKILIDYIRTEINFAQPIE